MRITALVLCLMAAGLAPRAVAQYTQQGTLNPTGNSGLSDSYAISADGSTAIVGGPLENNQVGNATIYVRSNGVWSKQATGLMPNDAISLGHFGSSVALSADGNVAVIGANGEHGGNGGAWIFTRSNGTWMQFGSKLFGTGGVAGPAQGSSAAMSADGNTVLVGGAEDNFAQGAVWVFTRSGNGYTQQGLKLVGTGAAPGFVFQGSEVAISADGNTVISGARGDAGNTGAAWIFVRTGNTWNQQGAKLVGAGAAAISLQTISVALSADGNTAMIGHPLDSSLGAAWVFTRSGATWTQQGNKLTGTGADGKAQQGTSVALSGDGNTAVLGGPSDGPLKGAAWVFQRSGGTWTQQGSKLVGTGGFSFHGDRMAMTPDGSTLLVGGGADAWVFTGPPSAGPAPGSANPAAGSGGTQVFTFTFSDFSGWQHLTVVDVLINNALDGRQACYVAFQPTGSNAGSVFLVDDAGDAGGPYSGMQLPGTGVVNNSQCTITGAGSSAVTGGDTLTLTLAISFAPGFAGNKIFYTAAADAASNSGWQPLGTWNIPGPAVTGPAVMTLTNANASGLSQTYTFTFADSNGWQDLTVANVLINSAINGVGACYIAFLPAGANTGAVDLVDDQGDAAGPYSGMTLPGSGSVSNGQCTISGAGSSVMGSGTTVQLTLAVTFTPGFGGKRIVYAAAGSNTQNSGWQAVGTFAAR